VWSLCLGWHKSYHNSIDVWPCLQRPTDELRSQTKKLGQTDLVYWVVGRLGVLETWVFVSRPVFTSLGLGLGFLKSWSRSWSWDLGKWRVQRAASIAKKSSVCLSPLLLWSGYLATVPVVCWCGQILLEWVTTCCHSWSTELSWVEQYLTSNQTHVAYIAVLPAERACYGYLNCIIMWC